MTVAVQPGDLLRGKYRVERILGVGGMGVVVAARHLRLDELVAVKFLLPEAAKDPQTVERFAREARAASKIKSEHVARVTDVDTLEGGETYLVMELLEGVDLADHLQRRGPLGIEEAVGYMLQVCEGIAEAHALGIVHRDLKPENLFLANRREGGTIIKVLDFGISKLLSAAEADAGLTHSKGIVGSPHYMSPEQLLSSRTVDARTDVWAMGATLYELLTGRPPFHGDTLPETCALVMHAAAEPPRRARPEIPVGLEAVILNCLQKDRAKRYGTMSELARALEPFGPPRAQMFAERASMRFQHDPASGSFSVQSSRAAERRRESSQSATIKATSVTPAATGRRRSLFLGFVAIGGLAAMVVLGQPWRRARRGSASEGPETSVGSIDLPALPASVASPPSMASSVSSPSASAGASRGPEAPSRSGPVPEPSSSGASHGPKRALPRRPAPASPPPQPVAEDTIGF